MLCPKCNTEMDDPSEGYGYECKECGCIVCPTCQTVYTGVENLDAVNSDELDERSTDYYCTKCDAIRLYSVDW